MQTGTALLIEQAHDNHLAQLLEQIREEQPVDPRLILVDTRILMAILRELGWLRLK